MMRVLVTGADGFVGRAACIALAEAGHHVIAGTRTGEGIAGAAEYRRLGDLAHPDGMDHWVANIDAIVHLAARVHIMTENSSDPLAEFRRVNVEGTRYLAEAARAAGVRRLVFLSSVKVNGETTTGAPFTENDPASPQDSYGQSKWEAEQILRDMGSNGTMETVILRSPLVYGPGVKGNFLSLLKLSDTGLPLPFGCMTKSRRSLIYVKNLAQALCLTISHPAAAGKTYFICDGEAVAIADLVRMIRAALDRPARLMPLPASLFRGIMACAGRTAAADRLSGSLVVDDSRIRIELGWEPRFSLRQGIGETIVWFRQTRTNSG